MLLSADTFSITCLYRPLRMLGGGTALEPARAYCAGVIAVTADCRRRLQLTRIFARLPYTGRMTALCFCKSEHLSKMKERLNVVRLWVNDL